MAQITQEAIADVGHGGGHTAQHLAEGHLKEGKLDLAESAFRTVMDMKPDNTAALNNLATVLQDLGRLDEALVVADQAVARDDQWQAQALATRNGIRQAMQKRQQ